MDQLDFSEFFKTKIEANDFSTRLSTLTEQLYETNFNLEKAVVDQFGSNKKAKLMIMLRDNNISTESNAALKQFFDRLQEKMRAMPVLSVTLAFEPNSQTLEALSQWFLLNEKKQVLFDIIVDQKIIAGASFTFRGKFLDCSIREIFERIFQETVNNKASNG